MPWRAPDESRERDRDRERERRKEIKKEGKEHELQMAVKQNRKNSVVKRKKGRKKREKEEKWRISKERLDKNCVVFTNPLFYYK